MKKQVKEGKNYEHMRQVNFVAVSVRVRIVDHPDSNYFAESVFGFTVAPAVATVYYESALRLAQIDNASYTRVILGCVMVHEIDICCWERERTRETGSCKRHGITSSWIEP